MKYHKLRAMHEPEKKKNPKIQEKEKDNKISNTCREISKVARSKQSHLLWSKETTEVGSSTTAVAAPLAFIIGTDKIIQPQFQKSSLFSRYPSMGVAISMQLYPWNFCSGNKRSSQSIQIGNAYYGFLVFLTTPNLAK